jgi:hypothetical protein
VAHAGGMEKERSGSMPRLKLAGVARARPAPWDDPHRASSASALAARAWVCGFPAGKPRQVGPRPTENSPPPLPFFAGFSSDRPTRVGCALTAARAAHHPLRR